MSNFYYEDQIAWQVVEAGKVKRRIKAYGPGIMMVEVFFENNAQGYTHKHPHEQTTYCMSGEFSFTVGGETKVIRTGDSIYMPANIPHGCQLLSSEGLLLDVFAPMREDFLA